jgi:hypothetical protein
MKKLILTTLALSGFILLTNYYIPGVWGYGFVAMGHFISYLMLVAMVLTWWLIFKVKV